jgi:hypothetical protein
MRSVRILLADSKRAQRGSVLSAVLIMVAFLSIISGALMTELSTQFLVSRVLVNRVGAEATVNSAMELALDQLQNTTLASGCPGATVPLPALVTLNGRTAAVSYVSCAPVVDVRSPQFTSVATSSPFSIDAFHGVVNGQDLYLVGDSGGTVFQYKFGLTTPVWSMSVNANITGPPLTMADTGASPPDPQDISNLVPIVGGGSSGCTANYCVKLMQQDTNQVGGPDVFCFMGATGRVSSRPAAGVAFPNLAYFGDASGTLWVYSATEAGNCALQGSIRTPGNAAIVAGPIVFQNGSQDEIYVVTATSQLIRYTYDPGDSPALSSTDTVTLPFSNPVGVAVEKAGIPARVAITFAAGGAAIVTIPSNYDPTVGPSRGVAPGPGIANAPFWCSCPSGQQVGVAGLNGIFYVLDTNLNLVASYPTGSSVHTTPAADGVGEWFFGADNGYLYEVQQPPGQSTLVPVAQYGPFGGQVRSSVQVGGCSTGICIYLGAMNSNAYIVPLNARDARITACLSNALRACSSDNPRLWAQVEIGDSVGPHTVHVQGWSYYSP